MSSDHYAQHIIQKHRLAIAIAVIKTNPQTKSLDEHINDLRNKINDEENNENNDKMEDLNITICSDDFDVGFNENEYNDDVINDVSQNSDTILRDFDMAPVSFELGKGDEEFHNIINIIEEASQGQILNEYNAQSTFCETQPQLNAYITTDNLTDIDKTFCDSIARIHHNNIMDIENTCDAIAKIYQTKATINTNVAKNTVDIDNKNETDNTYYDTIVNEIDIDETVCETLDLNKNFENNDKAYSSGNSRKGLEEPNLDSQATELYTMNCFTQNNTHVSQSQTHNFDVSDKYIKGTRKNNIQRISEDIEENIQVHTINKEFGHIKDVNLVRKTNTHLDKHNPIHVEVYNFDNDSQKVTDVDDNDNFQQTQDPIDIVYEITLPNNFKDDNLVRNNRNLDIDKAMGNNDSFDQNNGNNRSYSDQDKLQQVFTINNTQNISSYEVNHQNSPEISILENLRSKDNQVNYYNINNPQKIKFDTNYHKEDIAKTRYESNTPKEMNSIQEKTNTKENLFENIKIPYYDINNAHRTHYDDQTKNRNNKNLVNKLSKSNIDNATMELYNLSENNDVASKNINAHLTNYNDNTEQANNKNTVNKLSKSSIDNSSMEIYNFNKNNDMTSKNIDDEEDMSSELVPFKVIEELSRVKAYLSRGDRRVSYDSSLDSGYRSDSQRSRSGLQSSDNFVSQSAYCLYKHLNSCAIVDSTQDIVDEISQVLGLLIDRLHEEESYPSFLEEILEHVEYLINCIFTDDEMVFEKENKIHRLILLNKSTHIIKYSVEKLTNILENIHTHMINTEEIYELTDIQKTENLSYIFHILEVILKKYYKNRTTENITNSQMSQEIDSLQKRSSISEIWRKKWNPNFKATKIEGSLEKHCVFRQCSDVLNKIVVGCMEGYSLVAFAALQCFNLLQF